MDIFYKLLAAVLTAVLPVLAGFICDWIHKAAKECIIKAKNEKTKALVEEIDAAVTSAVVYVNQTFVAELKKSGVFASDPEYAQAAFDSAMQTVLETISEDAKEYIAGTFGNIAGYLEVKIEERVYDEKRGE